MYGKDIGPIFVMSNPRSGSTLLRFLIDGHPEVCCPAELRLGAICEVMLAAAEKAWGPGRLENGPRTMAASSASVRNSIGVWLEGYAASRGKRYWCEKTPFNLDHLNAMNVVFPNASYICLHRHAADCVRSVVETWGHGPQFMGHVRAEFLEDQDGDAVSACLQQWCVYTERLLALEGSHSGRVVRLRYEDLLKAPEREMAGLCRGLGLVWKAGLGSMALEKDERSGPGDYKARSMRSIGRVRRRATAAWNRGAVRPSLRRRTAGLLVRLGYKGAPIEP